MASGNSSTNVYDCIVLGFGGVGSAALRESAKRGWNVLGIDQFGPAHDSGSSHGQSRIIRRTYFEHPSYVPLAERAFEMWDELNKRHRTSPDVKELLTPVGILQLGHPDSEVIRGVQASATQHDLTIEHFSPEEIERRLPIFNIPSNYVGLFEPDAGFLRVELCVAAAIKQAVKHGAQLQSNTTVQGWSVDDQGLVSVNTDRGDFVGKRLIVTGGAWSSQLLPDVELELQVVQKQQHWFQLDRVDQKLANQFPAFLMELDNGDCFYGIPEIDYLGMKICEHSGGKDLPSADAQSPDLNQQALERTEKFMNDHLKFGRSRLVHHSNCMYTMSPDGHFIVDVHPKHQNVSFAAGLSGHGFKFAPVLGKYLVELLDGKRDSEMEFLRIRTDQSPTR